MQAHLRPSSRLIHSSPLVVPKYSPNGSDASPVIAWRFTVHHACFSGRPESRRCQVLPPLRVVYTAGLPSGLVRGHTVVPSIGNTHTVLSSRGCTTSGKPMSPTFFGMLLPMRTHAPAPSRR